MGQSLKTVDLHGFAKKIDEVFFASTSGYEKTAYFIWIERGCGLRRFNNGPANGCHLIHQGLRFSK